MKKNFKLEIDKKALKKVAEEAFIEEAFSGNIEYDCPDCGRKIKITGPENTCECGFVLKVELDPVKF